MEFIRLIRSRFADPLTAIDLSNRFVCHGSAMGRIAFYDIEKGVELVLFDSQPELIRGISHSASGNEIYISIGDVSCQKLDARTLHIVDNVLIVEDPDERQHKSNCERSITLLHQQFNCVLTINMPRDTTAQLEELAPITISDLEESMLNSHTPENLKFTQNSVPFDFDGDHIIYMDYKENNIREIWMYMVQDRQMVQLLRFTKADPIVSHVKLTKNSAGGLMLVYVQGSRQIKTYDVQSKTHQLVSIMPDSVLALHVRANKLRPCDRPDANGQGAADAEAQQETQTQELMISAVDDSENVFVYFFNLQTKTCNVRNCNIKQVDASEDAAASIKNKHFFGMGYPYFISGYDKHVAVTTDYGVLLFSVQQSNQAQQAQRGR